MTVRLSPSIAISVGVHALLAVGWWIVEVEPDLPTPAIAQAPVIQLVEPAPAETVVEVVMLDEVPRPAAAAPAVKAPALTAPRRRPSPAIATSHATQQELAPPVATVEAPRSSMFDFRKGIDLEGRGRDAIKLATPTLERIAMGGGEQLPPSVVIDNHENAIVDKPVRESVVTAEVTRTTRGRYKIDDLVFKGRIEKDGSVTLKDKPNIQHQFKSWKHIKHVLRTMGPFGLLQLDFDITAAVMKKKKMDPYASRKLAFLDETREARVELGKQYRTEVLAKTAEITLGNLEIMWAATTEPAARKQALFEMWDEVDESGEEELVEAGKAARVQVLGFIRSHLPKGTANAFTDDDIAGCNRRRHSRTEFAPY